MSRRAKRTWFSVSAVISVAMGVAIVAAMPSSAQQSSNTQAVERSITFEQRLLIGLRVKTQSDAQFIEAVVEQVELRNLPVRLVDSTYFWARSKAARRGGFVAQNPMVYFRPGMTARAKAIGVSLR